MADNIGVLGSSTAASVGTHTPYTVPSGKAAKVKIMFRGTAGVSSTLALIINGMTVFTTAALSSGNISFSTTLVMHNSDAAANIVGGADATTIAPGPKEYYLSAGDTVQYTIGTAAFSAMDVQVVGIETDAS